MSDENIIHRVERDDCLGSIAEKYGLRWETIWYLPENSDLRDLRKNPNVLMEGDQVVIPPKQIQFFSRATGAKHRFVRKGVPSQFKMKFLVAGRPRANVPFNGNIDGRLVSGQTDGDGFVNFRIPPGAQTATLTLTGAGGTEVYQLNFGQLNPVDEISGIQQRLANLGHDCEITGEWDEATIAAASFFRADRDLPESDEIDDDLKNALLDAHGS